MYNVGARLESLLVAQERRLNCALGIECSILPSCQLRAKVHNMLILNPEERSRFC